MIVLPAIDLKDHQVVRLRKGEFDTVHRVAEDPLQTARAFAAAGAKYIHMVDLDGARSGGPEERGGGARRGGALRPEGGAGGRPAHPGGFWRPPTPWG